MWPRSQRRARTSTQVEALVEYSSSDLFPLFSSYQFVKHAQRAEMINWGDSCFIPLLGAAFCPFPGPCEGMAGSNEMSSEGHWSCHMIYWSYMIYSPKTPWVWLLLYLSIWKLHFSVSKNPVTQLSFCWFLTDLPVRNASSSSLRGSSGMGMLRWSQWAPGNVTLATAL